MTNPHKTFYVNIVLCRAIGPWFITVFNRRFSPTVEGISSVSNIEVTGKMYTNPQYCGNRRTSWQVCQSFEKLKMTSSSVVGPKPLLKTVIDHGLIPRQRTILTELTSAMRALEIQNLLSYINLCSL